MYANFHTAFPWCTLQMFLAMPYYQFWQLCHTDVDEAGDTSEEGELNAKDAIAEAERIAKFYREQRAKRAKRAQ